MNTPGIYKRLGLLTLLVGPLTTLVISPYSSFDPINLIKVVFVSSISFSILALIAIDLRTAISRLPRGIWFSACFFFLWMTLVLFVSKAPLNQQFWGVFGRNNGYLSYLSLILILLGVALVQDKKNYHKLVEVLVLTSIPMTGYALIQIAGQDPFSWSVMAPFATLGNVNFSSAFFGLASICAMVLALKPKQHFSLRFFLLVLVLTNTWIIVKTGSIQGLMIGVAGLGVAGFLIVRTIKPLKIMKIPYLILGLFVFALTTLALYNIGPLARFIFSETVLYRFDYWYAGWAMTFQNPLFGVGLDSYGDWYREFRGEIATLRTTPDRVTNTAHNIYLDISASGGFPLIIAYVILLGYGARAVSLVLKRETAFDPYFVALVSTWVAYLIQAAISINQIGVGIWGWLFTGALIGYEIATRDDARSPGIRTSSPRNSPLKASAAVLSIAGFGVGFMVSFIPFNADQSFKESLQSGDVSKQFAQSKALGATAFHMELSLDAAIKANNEPLAREIIDELIARYPRDFMAWRVKRVLVSATPEEREAAYQKLRSMDPYNPEIRPLE